jgi:hypothetical protein
MQAGQIEVRFSKHVISYLSGVTQALVGPFPTFVSMVQHHGGSSPASIFARLAGKTGVPSHLPFIFPGIVAIWTQPERGLRKTHGTLRDNIWNESIEPISFRRVLMKSRGKLPRFDGN